LGFSSWIKVWMKINSRRPLSRTRAEGADQFAWTIPTLYRVCVSSRGTPDRYTELLLDHIGSHHNLIWLGAATGDADGADAGRPQGRGQGRDRVADRHRPAAAPDAGRPPGGAAVPHRPQGPPVGRDADVDPTTGRARLSYRRAAELFDAHTAGISGGPFTLHQLRHSALTHAVEDGASTPMLMKMSGHTSVRSLAKYARPSAEALARWRAETDPAARGRR
jgi:hypothetical protein